jgi:hypothetical protein
MSKHKYKTNDLSELQIVLNTETCDCMCHDFGIGLIPLTNKPHKCCLNPHKKKNIGISIDFTKKII